MTSSPKPDPKSKGRPHDDPEQSKRFLEAAKEHGAATTEEEATRAFRKAVGKPKQPGRK